MSPREILIHLAIKYSGDYKQMMKAIEEREYEDIKNLEDVDYHSKAITILDDDYPQIFKHFYAPPIVLFYHGNISLLNEHDKNLAVIGTRSYSKYGEKMTKKIVQEMDKDVNIVSGLAYGIDAIAHAQALLDGGNTIAILGSGINYCYPSENKELYEKIKKHGLIISEYPDMTPPSPEKFPFRNRIIAFCSKTILITEAHSHSGTSITAGIGIDIGKDVCCVPYPADANSFCNRLIACGAYLVENGEDLRSIISSELKRPVFEN